jgi:hypothetical protein
MTDAARFHALAGQLFARHHRGEHLYAVLDGARDPSIHVSVRTTGMPARCLYAGGALQHVAPYLVQLHPVHAFTEELLTTAWGKSWGVFAASTASLEEMRRHLRRFLRAELEDGRKVVFRYYDPRVLRVYLPTCTRGELEQLFGPISAFFVEAEHPATLLAFERVAGSFAMAKIPLPEKRAAAESRAAE